MLAELLAPTHTPAYAAEFETYLRSGEPTAALQTDQSDTGGYLAPPQFVADVARELDSKFWFRGLCTVLPPTAAPRVIRPRRAARPDGMAWSAEVAPPTPDAGYKLGYYSLTPHYQSAEFEVSADLLRGSDAAAVVAEEVVRLAGDGEAGFVGGNGAGQPVGLFTPLDQGVGTDRDVSGDITDFSAFRFGLLGDLAFYDVVDGLAVTITRLTDTYYARRNMAGFVVRRKVDGCPRVAEAFRRLKVQ